MGDLFGGMGGGAGGDSFGDGSGGGSGGGSDPFGGQGASDMSGSGTDSGLGGTEGTDAGNVGVSDTAANFGTTPSTNVGTANDPSNIAQAQANASGPPPAGTSPTGAQSGSQNPLIDQIGKLLGVSPANAVPAQTQQPQASAPSGQGFGGGAAGPTPQHGATGSWDASPMGGNDLMSTLSKIFSGQQQPSQGAASTPPASAPGAATPPTAVSQTGFPGGDQGFGGGSPAPQTPAAGEGATSNIAPAATPPATGQDGGQKTDTGTTATSPEASKVAPTADPSGGQAGGQAGGQPAGGGQGQQGQTPQFNPLRAIIDLLTGNWGDLAKMLGGQMGPQGYPGGQSGYGGGNTGGGPPIAAPNPPQSPSPPLENKPTPAPGEGGKSVKPIAEPGTAAPGLIPGAAGTGPPGAILAAPGAQAAGAPAAGAGTATPGEKTGVAPGQGKLDAFGNVVPANLTAGGPQGGPQAGAPQLGANPAADRWVSPQWAGRSRNAGTDTPGTPGYSSTMREVRAPAFQGLTPQDRRILHGMMQAENATDPLGPMESIANRAASEGMTIHQFLQRWGPAFYGPWGSFGRRGAAIDANPRAAAHYDSVMTAVQNGSNVLGGATDQGSGRDRNVGHTGGRVMRSGEVYNDWGGGRGHAYHNQWRHQVQARVRAENQTAATTGLRNQVTDAPTSGGADWRTVPGTPSFPARGPAAIGPATSPVLARLRGGGSPDGAFGGPPSSPDAAFGGPPGGQRTRPSWDTGAGAPGTRGTPEVSGGLTGARTPITKLPQITVKPDDTAKAADEGKPAAKTDAKPKAGAKPKAKPGMSKSQRRAIQARQAPATPKLSPYGGGSATGRNVQPGDPGYDEAVRATYGR